jgi:uncharacterized protein (DUF885 family)
VLAFHESVPGHHTQIALAMEMTGLPEFRKHLGPTSFVEGWALYTERLTDEMGLYSADLDRMGKLSFDAWRASRLVVDTGIHVKGWSRQQAIAYMLDNTALAKNNIENEVDRYIGWPGQALAYKIGQREIQKLRHEAETALGPASTSAASTTGCWPTVPSASPCCATRSRTGSPASESRGTVPVSGPTRPGHAR